MKIKVGVTRILVTALLVSMVPFSADANSGSTWVADGDEQSSEQGSGSDLVATIADCVAKPSNDRLGIVFLLDTSQSLKFRDPNNARVTATQESLNAMNNVIESLAAAQAKYEIETRDFSFDVKIDGFGAQYYDGEWTELSGTTNLSALLDRANSFSSRTTDPYTDYRAAARGALNSFEDYDAQHGSSNCKLLFWFTDGQYDTDDSKIYGNTPYLDADEVAEILSADLCEAGGVVDRLRRLNVGVVGLGLNREGGTADFSLLRSIVTNADFMLSPRNVAVVEGTCGAEAATGEFAEASVRDLVDKFTDVLVCILIDCERTNEPPCDDGSPGPDCREDESSGIRQTTSCVEEPRETCPIEFSLSRAESGFNLWYKASEAEDFEATIEDPDGNSYKLGDSDEELASGLELNKVSNLWRWVSGNQNDFISANNIWAGEWTVTFTGLDPDDPPPVIGFFWNDLEILPVTTSPALFRDDPATFDSLKFSVSSNGLPFEGASTGVLDVRFEAVDESGVTIAESREEYSDWKNISPPVGFLEQLVAGDSAPWRERAGFSITATPIAVTLETASIFNEYESQMFSFWFQDDISLRPDSVPEVYDRSLTESDINAHETRFDLYFGDSPLRDPNVDVSIEGTASLGDEARSFTPVVGNGRVMEIPTQLFTELLQPPSSERAGRRYIPGGSLRYDFEVLLSWAGDPAVAAPQRKSSLSTTVPVRSGAGYPAIGQLPDYTVFGKDLVDLKVPIIPPLAGIGTVTLESAELLNPQEDQEYFVDGNGICEVALGDTECTFSLGHNFQWRDPVEVRLTFGLSGSEVDDGENYSVDERTVSIIMTRPPCRLCGLSTAFALVLVFIVIQLLIRALWVTLSARFEGVGDGTGSWRVVRLRIPAPSSTGSLRVSPDEVIARLGVAEFVDSIEQGGSQLAIGPIDLHRNWLDTFLGGRRNARTASGGGVRTFLRTGRSVLTAQSAGNMVISNSGAAILKDGSVVGEPSRNLAELWVLEIPVDYLTYQKEATLSLVLDVSESQEMVRQNVRIRINEIDATVNDVLTAVEEHQQSEDVSSEADGDGEGEGPGHDGNSEDDWKIEDDDWQAVGQEQPSGVRWQFWKRKSSQASGQVEYGEPEVDGPVEDDGWELTGQEQPSGVRWQFWKRKSSQASGQVEYGEPEVDGPVEDDGWSW